MNKLLARSLAISLMAALAQPAGAQTQQAPAPATTPSQDLLKAEELDQLLASIALYPDALLSEVLMASTYPLEVIEASRWADANKNLKDAQLKAAADKQSWDDSVKSLTATPSVLHMMSTQLSWMQKLGDAVLAQQSDVMDSVQRLRARAQAQDKLKSTKEQKVSTKTEANKQVIVIEPSEPNTVYVPYYNPSVVYGDWPYPAYPPYYYPPPAGYYGYYGGAAIATGIAFGVGIAVGAWAAGGRYWGGGFGWGGNNININRQTNINNINNNWRHNPAHRQGVRYNNAKVANQFNRGNAVRNNAGNRMDFRGRDGQRPNAGGGNRPANAGNRPSNKPANAGNRPGNKPANAGNRAGNKKPANAGNRGGNRPANAGNRGGGRDNAFGNSGGGGRAAMAQSQRGHASLGGGGGHSSFAGRGGG
ncbi:MAG: DUF3300 domain-containing protein, partial [Pseudolabrys sp.]